MNADFLKEIYDRVEARDLDGLRRLTESASTPFQKALGFASLEHLMILARKPEVAEELAATIPESDSSSALAKAEALSAAGAARLREHDDEAARGDFSAATKVVESLRDLPLGRVSVLVTIATAQLKGGLIEDSNLTFRAAIGLAQDFPQRPKPQARLPRQTVVGAHYRDEAFKRILTAAIKEGDVAVANDLIRIWNNTSTSSN